MNRERKKTEDLMAMIEAKGGGIQVPSFMQRLNSIKYRQSLRQLGKRRCCVRSLMQAHPIASFKMKQLGVVKTIHFGSVSVVVREPNIKGIKRNIEAGQNALARAMGKIVNPGVIINNAKDVPLYYADPEQPRLIIRERNGKLVRGTFKNGKFKLCR